MKHHVCNDTLKKGIAANLAKFNKITLSAENLRRAAVAVTVVDYQGKSALSGLLAAPDAASDGSQSVVGHYALRRHACHRHHVFLRRRAVVGGLGKRLAL